MYQRHGAKNKDGPGRQGRAPESQGGCGSDDEQSNNKRGHKTSGIPGDHSKPDRRPETLLHCSTVPPFSGRRKQSRQGFGGLARRVSASDFGLAIGFEQPFLDWLEEYSLTICYV
jgi:hypothetical protein